MEFFLVQPSNWNIAYTYDHLLKIKSGKVYKDRKKIERVTEMDIKKIWVTYSGEFPLK